MLQYQSINSWCLQCVLSRALNIPLYLLITHPMCFSRSSKVFSLGIFSRFSMMKNFVVFGVFAAPPTSREENTHNYLTRSSARHWTWSMNRASSLQQHEVNDSAWAWTFLPRWTCVTKITSYTQGNWRTVTWYSRTYWMIQQGFGVHQLAHMKQGHACVHGTRCSLLHGKANIGARIHYTFKDRWIIIVYKI